MTEAPTIEHSFLPLSLYYFAQRASEN